MTLSTRGALVRNGVVAGVNGAITLTLLLIAPLGLAAVITNTALITASTFVVGIAADGVVRWLSPLSRPGYIPPQSQSDLERSPYRSPD
ncbi:CRISPR-associated protein Csx18 [Spirulina sp. CCNP1310]|uniref:CRISPR-associated protein Csx18 n=1 Tax=Spirulina sp. CCNP1310 TaxID=3110249 RepID=UPI002B1F2F95|nr:CRISPR-associated protein Csx18 [Spirulina sp. CCNP1310]MEA5421100.1 CRISPR-associated protein Csx18 [Spirulina sp. CCNP1310]